MRGAGGAKGTGERGGYWECWRSVNFSNIRMESGGDLLSRAVTSQVPSARGGLTSVFGMGTGGSLQPLSPEIGMQFSSSCAEHFALRFLPFQTLPRFGLAPAPAPSKPHRKSLTAHSGSLGSPGFCSLGSLVLPEHLQRLSYKQFQIKPSTD